MVLTIGMPLLIASLGAEDHRNASSERNPPTPSPPPVVLSLTLQHTLMEHTWYNGDKSVLGRHRRF